MMDRPLQLFFSFPTAPLTDWAPNGDGLLAHRVIAELAARVGGIQSPATD